MINHKKIFKCFSCFWKVFCFYKKCQNFKNSVTLFWQLSCGLIQSHAPVASPLKYFSQLIGRLMSQSQKILRKFFKIWVFMFLAAQIGNLFTGEGSSCEGYSEIFAAYFVTPSQVELPVTKNACFVFQG